MLPLSLSEIGEEHVIKRISGSFEIQKYLKSLRFVSGSNIMVVNMLKEN